MGSRKLIPYFALIVHAAFALLVTILPHFYPSDCLCHPTAGERVSGRMELSCLPGLTHKSVVLMRLFCTVV